MQPPLTPVAADEPLYEAFYGLREQPFALTTDPRFLFMGDAQRRAFDELLTGLRRREGLLLLTGDTGTGKTTLCRAVLDALGPRTFSALILNPYMSDAEVLRVILRDFGLVTREEIRKGAFARADVPQLLDTLEGFLHSVITLDSHAVVVIDEAQSLSPTVLDQIRVLGGLERDGQRLLQLVLSGQPELLSTLQSDAMRALNERISRRTKLGPLAAADIEAYLRHRLAVAGGQDALSFMPESVSLIAELSRRIPRRINLLCDRTLEEGRIEGTTVITPALVRRAHQASAGVASAPTRAARVVPDAETPPVPGLNELTLRSDDEAPEADSPVDAPALFGAAEPASASRGRRVALWLAAVLLLVAGGGGYAVWRYAQTDPGIPRLPVAPPPGAGPQLGPFPTPTDAEERYLMQELQRVHPWWRPDGGG